MADVPVLADTGFTTKEREIPTLLYYAVPESFMLELGHRTVGTLDSGCMNTKRETFRPWEMNG